MLELVLRVTRETTLGDLRAFVRMAAEMGDAMPIAHYDMHDELDGIAAAIPAQRGE